MKPQQGFVAEKKTQDDIFQTTPDNVKREIAMELAPVVKQLFSGFPSEASKRIWMRAVLAVWSVDILWLPSHRGSCHEMVRKEQHLAAVTGDFTAQTDQLLEHVAQQAQKHFPALRDAWISRIQARIDNAPPQLREDAQDMFGQVGAILQRARLATSRDELRPVWDDFVVLSSQINGMFSDIEPAGPLQ